MVLRRPDALGPTDALLVVRTPGHWALAPARRRDVVPVDVDELVALLSAEAGGELELPAARCDQLLDAGVLREAPADPMSSSARHGRAGRPQPEAADGHRVAPLGEQAVLEPRAAVVGRLTARGLELESTSGAQTWLDATDVHLVDAVDAWCTVAEAVDRVCSRPTVGHDRQDLAARLARLVDSGRLRLVRDDAGKTVETVAPPDRSPIDAGSPGPPPTQGPEDAESPATLVPPGDVRAGWPSRRRRRLLRRLRRRSVDAAIDAAAPHAQPVDAPEPIVEPAGPSAAPRATAHMTVEPPPPESRSPHEPSVTYLADPFPGGRAGPVPVYAVWPVDTGPVLALGMLTAAARHHEAGRLATWYEIRRPEDPESFFADLAGRGGPAVLLVSNYVWSLEANLKIVQQARALCPRLIVVHGGPSTPKHEADAARFFERHGSLIDIAVRGEGERTLVELLEALGPSFPEPDLALLRDVAGLTFRDPRTGLPTRTADRDRLADLDVLPSPYLTGEFDHLPAAAWDVPSGLLGLVLETNRGCPYGCTFCDWGSSTLSRIRKFSMERVQAEMRWAATRGFHAWILADANFGIIARDVTIAEHVAALRAEQGLPNHLGFNVAKNTTKHLTAILEHLVAAGVIPHFSLALQTRDAGTLEAVARTNISVDHYLALAATFRRRGLPVDADLMVGLPGQTVDSFCDDLQFLLDHEIPARMWITELLPNAPMNDPAYRERFAIEAGENLVVTATSTFSVEDRRTMMRVRHAYTAFERFGILRYVLRYVQWDHGVPAMTVLRRIIDASDREPERYPLLNWVMRYFDYFNAVPVGWRAFLAEVGRFLAEEFDIGSSTARDAVLQAQAFLLPEVDRQLPAVLPLPHDLVQYVRDHTRSLWRDGRSAPPLPLSAYAPGVLTVYGDPLGHCTRGAAVNGDPRNEVLTERFWLDGQWELDSPLVANLPEVAAAGSFVGLAASVPADLADQLELAPQPAEEEPVAITRRQRSA